MCKVEEKQSVWEEFKDVFPFLLIATLVFAVGMFIGTLTTKKTQADPGYWFDLCLESEATRAPERLALCAHVSYIISERHRK